eukprot:6087170-Pleurochrysis_carterae.AAC.1
MGASISTGDASRLAQAILSAYDAKDEHAFMAYFADDASWTFNGGAKTGARELYQLASSSNRSTKHAVQRAFYSKNKRQIYSRGSIETVKLDGSRQLGTWSDILSLNSKGAISHVDTYLDPGQPMRR